MHHWVAFISLYEVQTCCSYVRLYYVLVVAKMNSACVNMLTNVCPNNVGTVNFDQNDVTPHNTRDQNISEFNMLDFNVCQKLKNLTGLQFVHLNVNGAIRKKVALLNAFFGDGLLFDFVCLSETHFRSSLDTFEIKDFNPDIADPGRGGGVEKG